MENVIYEFKKIHLVTFLKYINKNHNFNLIINFLSQNNNNKQSIISLSSMIKNFLKKALEINYFKFICFRDLNYQFYHNYLKFLK